MTIGDPAVASVGILEMRKIFQGQLMHTSHGQHAIHEGRHVEGEATICGMRCICEEDNVGTWKLWPTMFKRDNCTAGRRGESRPAKDALYQEELAASVLEENE